MALKQVPRFGHVWGRTLFVPEPCPRIKKNLYCGTCVVRAERIFVAAVVAHDLAGQRVVGTSEAAHIHTHAVMPVARHPTVTAFNASRASINIGEILVEA